MGERSNIFVRIRAKENTKDKKYTYGTFFGLYYQWCYGERMISRLRSAIDFAEKHLDGWHGRAAVDPERIEKFKRYLAINFDMRDIVEPTDLIPYTVENLKQGFATPGADIFAQEENHGYIYVDISLDDPDRTYGDYKAKVKYAFARYDCGRHRRIVQNERAGTVLARSGGGESAGERETTSLRDIDGTILRGERDGRGNCLRRGAGVGYVLRKRQTVAVYRECASRIRERHASVRGVGWSVRAASRV